MEKHIKITNGLEYTFLENKGEIGIFKFRNATRKFRLVYFCGVKTAINMDGTKILCEQIKPIYDAEIDGYNSEKINVFNKNGETYVNIFKSHQKI